MDYLLWPQSMVMRHLHNLVWYVALVAAVSRVHRRMIPTPWLAGLATLMYALDDAHGFPTTWTANRNARIATTLGALSVWLHMRWRESGRTRDAVAAPALLALALLGGESAVSLPAYTVAYALTIDRDRPVRRILSLAPTAAVLVLWRVLYVHLGYGVGGSELYVDPATNPLRFASAGLARLPALLLGQLTPVPSELQFFLPGAASIAFSILGTAFVAGLAWAARDVLRTSAPARFAALGMALALIPVLATFPNNRLLLGSGIGAFALVAVLLGSAATGLAPESGSPAAARFSRHWAALLAGTHLILAPLSLPLNAYTPQFFVNGYDTAAVSLDRAGPLPGSTLVVVNGPDFFFTSWPPLFRLAKGLSYASTLRVLGTTLTAVDVTRVDHDTLRLHPDDGYVNSPLDPLLRRADQPFSPGDAFDYDDMRMVVESMTADGRPASVRWTFLHGFDGDRYTWAAWWPDGYRAFEVPAVGQTVRLPAFTPRDIARVGLNGP